MRTISRGVTGALLIAVSAMACTSGSDTPTLQAGQTPAASTTGNAALAHSLLEERDMIVIYRDQMVDLRAKADLTARATAFAKVHAPLVAELQTARPRAARSLGLVNAFAMKLTPTEVDTLSLRSEIAAVVPDHLLRLPSHKREKIVLGARGPGGIASSTPLCNTLEPEALQVTNTAFLDPSRPQAQNVIDGQGHKVTGRGVTVAVIADGLDPTDPGFVRTDGTSAIVDYQDFSGDPAGTPTAGAEIYGDASSVVAQDTPHGQVLKYDISTFVNPAHPLPSPCNIRVRGMAPDASLIALKAFSNGFTTTSNFVQAIEYAVAHGADVINESFGYNPVYDDTKDATSLANAAATRAGVTVTVSSGDAGTAGTIGTSATAKDVIAVGASTMTRIYEQTKTGLLPVATGAVGGNIASFSSGGFAQRRARVVDLVGPGDSGWALCSPNSALFQECTSASGAPSYVQDFGGTSQSAPLTAGAAALVIQAYRSTHDGADPSPATVKNILMSSAHDLGASADEQGAGLIDSLKAVNMALSLHDAEAAPAPRGAGLFASPASFNLTAHPNDIVAREFDVTNTGTGFRVITPALQKIGAPVAGATSSVTLGALTSPTYVDGFGITRAYVTKTFTVPNGVEHLDASIAFQGTPAGAAAKVVAFALLDPSGKQTAYSTPQGAGSNYGHVDVVKPVAGTWKAVFRTTASAGGYTGPITFSWAGERFVPAGIVLPPVAFLAPGQTGHFLAALETSSQAGDKAAAIRFDDESEIPFIVRTLIGTGPHGGTFAGTFTGGNGRAGALPTQTYGFDVPSGVASLGLELGVAKGYGVAAFLVDPNGKTLSSNSNLDASSVPAGTAVQLDHADPEPGRWQVVIEQAAAAGLATSSPFTGEIAFDKVDITAPTLPNSKQTKISKAQGGLSVPVHITNSGATEKTYFADARLNGLTQIQLPTGACTAATALPGFCSVTVLPPRAKAATFIAQSTVPIDMDASWVFGGPDIFAKPVAPNTVAATLQTNEVPWNAWFFIPSEKGPYGPEGAPAAQVATAAFVRMPAFDPAMTSDTGNLWADTVTGSATFAGGLVIEPGQTKTLTLTIAIDDTTAVGTVVKGFVSIDTLGLTDPYSMGDEVITLPYAYTVKK